MDEVSETKFVSNVKEKNMRCELTFAIPHPQIAAVLVVFLVPLKQAFDRERGSAVDLDISSPSLEYSVSPGCSRS